MYSTTQSSLPPTGFVCGCALLLVPTVVSSSTVCCQGMRHAALEGALASAWPRRCRCLELADGVCSFHLSYVVLLVLLVKGEEPGIVIDTGNEVGHFR